MNAHTKFPANLDLSPILASAERCEGICCEHARAALKDIIEPMVFKLAALMDDKTGRRRHSVMLSTRAPCFDDDCVEAQITLRGNEGRRKIEIFVSYTDEDGALFSFEGEFIRLDYVRFTLTESGEWLAKVPLRVANAEAYATGQYPDEIDVTDEFLRMLGAELSALDVGRQRIDRS